MNRILKNTAAIAFLVSASSIVPAEQVIDCGFAQEVVSAAADLVRSCLNNVKSHVLTDTVIDSASYGLKVAGGVLGACLTSSLIKRGFSSVKEHLLQQKIAEVGNELLQEAKHLLAKAEKLQVKAGECEAKAQKLYRAHRVADRNGIEAKHVEQIGRGAQDAHMEAIGCLEQADSLRRSAEHRLSTRAALLGLR